MTLCQVLELHHRFDLGEFAAEVLGALEPLGVGHQSGAHRHDSVALIAVAVGVDSEAAVSQDERPAILDRERGEGCSGGEIVLGFFENPRVLHRGSANHDPCDCGRLFAMGQHFAAGDVAIADHWHLDRACGGIDDVPVSFSRVALRSGPTMDCDAGNALGLQDATGLLRVDGVEVPSDPNLGRHWHLVADRSNDPARGGGEERTVFQERGAAVLGNHLTHRTAKVDVDKVGLLPVDDFFRSLPHPDPVCAKELHPDGSLLVGEFGILPGAMVRLHDPLCRDELSDHHIRTQLLADGAEGDIGHPRHRSEEEGELIVGKPRKHSAERPTKDRKGQEMQELSALASLAPIRATLAAGRLQSLLLARSRIVLDVTLCLFYLEKR